MRKESHLELTKSIAPWREMRKPPPLKTISHYGWSLRLRLTVRSAQDGLAGHTGAQPALALHVRPLERTCLEARWVGPRTSRSLLVTLIFLMGTTSKPEDFRACLGKVRPLLANFLACFGAAKRHTVGCGSLRSYQRWRSSSRRSWTCDRTALGSSGLQFWLSSPKEAIK